MPYVDGFLLPIPKKHLAYYKKMATGAGKVWLEHGALQFRECVAEDIDVKGVVSFRKLARAKPGDTVFFSWIVYKNRAHRDRVNKKVLSDPRMQKNMNPPFDMERMAYGGFKVFVDL